MPPSAHSASAVDERAQRHRERERALAQRPHRGGHHGGGDDAARHGRSRRGPQAEPAAHQQPAAGEQQRLGAERDRRRPPSAPYAGTSAMFSARLTTSATSGEPQRRALRCRPRSARSRTARTGTRAPRRTAAAAAGPRRPANSSPPDEPRELRRDHEPARPRSGRPASRTPARCASQRALRPRRGPRRGWRESSGKTDVMTIAGNRASSS